MTDSVAAGKRNAADLWRERIAEQRRGRMSVTQFCKERGVSQYSFYAWRKRLRKQEPVRFALIDRGRAADATIDACVELILPAGETLRIAPGVDATTLRTILEALRMIHLPAIVRVYLCLTPCDMRKSFDGLHALVRDHLELDAYAGHLFVFASRRRDRVKILYWDRDGFAIWEQAPGRGHVRRPVHRRGRRKAARDHGAGVGCNAERN